MGKVVLEMKAEVDPSLLLLCPFWWPYLKGLQFNICIVVHEQIQSMFGIQ